MSEQSPGPLDQDSIPFQQPETSFQRDFNREYKAALEEIRSSSTQPEPDQGDGWLEEQQQRGRNWLREQKAILGDSRAVIDSQPSRIAISDVPADVRIEATETRALASSSADQDSVARERYTETETERQLRTAAIAGERTPPSSTHSLRLLELEGGVAGIFKPAEGEKYISPDSTPGTYYKHERAAYLVDRALGLNVVPPTVIRSVDGKVGSLQLYMPNAQEIRDVEPVLTPKISEGLYRIWILDMAINQGDRFNDGVLIDPQQNIYAPDNGIAFEDGPPGYAATFYDSPAPPGVIKSLSAFTASESSRHALQGQLRELLPPAEASSCIARVYAMGAAMRNKGYIEVSDTAGFYSMDNEDPIMPSKPNST